MPTTDIQQSLAPLVESYPAVRRASLDLAAGLQVEDYSLQAMAEVSPPKWHLAHTSWFFETFILKPFAVEYQPFHPQFEYLFNSYYNGVGAQYPRARRGLLSRPTVNEIFDYRSYVDKAMLALLSDTHHRDYAEIQQRCILGLHHEQQHQELLCTDIKYSFSYNPLYPPLGTAGARHVNVVPSALRFIDCAVMEVDAGYRGEGFHFDNERPSHRVLLQGFRFANRLITNGEYLAFIEAGGYRDPSLWLADGWAWLQENSVVSPRYWLQHSAEWREYTLYGLIPLNLHMPLCHVNYYEADAYARWSGKRLPTEYEWESVCYQFDLQPSAQQITLHPSCYNDDAIISQMFGSLWQWTRSSYAPYPGYRPAAGAIGEYNGKFMCNQMVLRGSSCVTPPGHARPSYRNFFYPCDQWQFSGIRLADDL